MSLDDLPIVRYQLLRQLIDTWLWCPRVNKAEWSGRVFVSAGLTFGADYQYLLPGRKCEIYNDLAFGSCCSEIPPISYFIMAPEQKKRARSVPKASQRSQKRQKIEPAKKDDVKKQKVALDALPWNEVEMPDMFEDAEGFYGLEEVEGVEVVRDGNTVQFVRLLGKLETKYSCL